jgi:hypothetical protein
MQYYGPETELLRTLLYPDLHTIVPQSPLEESLRALFKFQERFRFDNIEAEGTSGGLAHELTPRGRHSKVRLGTQNKQFLKELGAVEGPLGTAKAFTTAQEEELLGSRNESGTATR